MKIIRQLGFGIFGFGGDSEPNNKKIRVHSERIEEKHQENRGFESGEKRKEFFRRSVRALLTSLPGDPRSTPNNIVWRLKGGVRTTECVSSAEVRRI